MLSSADEWLCKCRIKKRTNKMRVERAVRRLLLLTLWCCSCVVSVSVSGSAESSDALWEIHDAWAAECGDVGRGSGVGGPLAEAKAAWCRWCDRSEVDAKIEKLARGCEKQRGWRRDSIAALQQLRAKLAARSPHELCDVVHTCAQRLAAVEKKLTAATRSLSEHIASCPAVTVAALNQHHQMLCSEAQQRLLREKERLQCTKVTNSIV
jgi:hypothetical protein